MDALKRLRERMGEDSSLPLYARIEQGVEGLIEEGVFPPGARLPGDAALSGELGVNHLTVRRALNGLVEKGLIVRRKRAGTFVRQAASARSRSIGYFYMREDEVRKLRAAESAQVCLSEHGYDLKLVAMDDMYYDRLNLVDEIERMGLSGAIVTATHSPGCLQALAELEMRQFPVVRIGGSRGGRRLVSPLVRSNLPAAMRQSLATLRGLGHRRIGLMAADHPHEVHAIYRDFCEDTPGADPSWLLPIAYNGTFERWSDYAQGPLLIRGYLETHPELTAIIAEHPAVAWETAVQCRLAGRSVPDDLSLVALFDHVMLQGRSPAITAWRDSPQGMGRQAAERVAGLIGGAVYPPGVVDCIDHELIERGSVSIPAAAGLSAVPS